MKREHACEKCFDVIPDYPERGSNGYPVLCTCGGHYRVTCERIGCQKPATQTIYGLGYLASVCQEHYDKASQEDRDNAIRFRYAEG